jgi:hypothetical protein
MGMIADLISVFFGRGRNVVAETAQVFRENTEAGAARAATLQGAAMQQFAGEFQGRSKNGFDRFMDGINRLPRPALALGTLGLFVAAMVDPLWFAARMQGIALVPEPLWWLLGVIVSFYFGARHQLKSQNFQREAAAAAALAPQIVQNIRILDEMRADSPGAADPGPDVEVSLAAVTPEDNPALEDWRRLRRAA